MGTINLGPPVGENSRFELEVRLDPDNGCRIVPPQRVGETEMEERNWERDGERVKVGGRKCRAWNCNLARGTFRGGGYKRVSRIEDRGVSFADA